MTQLAQDMSPSSDHNKAQSPQSRRQMDCLCRVFRQDGSRQEEVVDKNVSRKLPPGFGRLEYWEKSGLGWWGLDPLFHVIGRFSPLMAGPPVSFSCWYLTLDPGCLFDRRGFPL